IDLVRSGQLVKRVNAVVLAGRSTYGLSAVAGVMRFLEERKRGFKLPLIDVRVPIVTAASIFDITTADSTGGLDADAGYQACLAASPEQFSAQGAIGVATGARVGKLYGIEHSCQGGVGSAIDQLDGYRVGALAVVNSFGSVYDQDSRLLAGPHHPQTGEFVHTFEMLEKQQVELTPWTNNALAVIVTDLPLEKSQVNALAQSAFAGWARSIKPSSAQTDGFVTYLLSTARTPKGFSSKIDEQQMVRLEAKIIKLLMLAIARSVSGHSPR
ncbi:P1 family peptidase, partial [Dehalococcoidia bacterium]|nr:P1 family peptidase [Dehalococcoidia bacterium]